MTKYYTVTTPDTGKDGKTRFHRVGVAFPQNEGAKSFMTIQLFANPCEWRARPLRAKSRQ